MRSRLIFLILVGLALFAARPARLDRWGAPGQQADGYTLTVHKSNGFNNGSQIRGLFSAEVSGPVEAVRKVRFLLDGSLMAELTEPPYKISFRTTEYPEGWHDMSAELTLADGQTLVTPPRRFDFISAEVESAFFTGVVLPLVGGIFGLLAVVFGVQLVMIGRSKPSTLPLGAPRSFGLKGGGVCPNCQRVFSLHWWSPNLINAVYDRCDFCSKWSVVRIASRAELAAALAAEAAAAQAEPLPGEKTAAEQLKDLLDDSRYTH